MRQLPHLAGIPQISVRTRCSSSTDLRRQPTSRPRSLRFIHATWSIWCSRALYTPSSSLCLLLLKLFNLPTTARQKREKKHNTPRPIFYHGGGGLRATAPAPADNLSPCEPGQIIKTASGFGCFSSKRNVTQRWLIRRCRGRDKSID